MKNLQNQRVLIIGGSNGMGLATAQRLAALGAEVIIAGRNQARLDEALKHIDSKAGAYTADFSDEASLTRLFTRLGHVDHLIITASSSAAWGSIRDIDGAALAKAFEQKALGYWRAIRAALPHLRKDGSITLLSGAASRVAIAGTAGLAAVNGAITQMGQALAKELAPIRVNVVSPGLIDTPVYDDFSPEAKSGLFENITKGLHVGRAGTSEEVAQAIEFVVTNGFTAGALIDIDGGAR
ncbi:SDR family oxidoreductase [Silvimonas iriomotensis]|uniref:Short-chain dehydrogenase n=1 Tax=Silvimonas iriomotensis TaxID=449662 RepID=A0ABQ2P6Q4_9NEIS|nr:SDR family oxidoreductase [Silvimonas iriomotensis]GGP19040.1 short-chain dehydrogenase [Silvimonas iriomotensis]